MTDRQTNPNGPTDSASYAAAAFADAASKPFPADIYTAPQLRWAVIGAAAMAQQMATSLALGGRTFHGVWNRTHSKAVDFARRNNVERVYDTVDELLADPEVDAVYITTPHNKHIEFMRQVLAAGKHALCEKPITLNSTELAEARSLADAHGVQLIDATTILHMPLYREIIRRAMADEFGKMNLAQINFGSYKEYDPSNHFYNLDRAGGAMLEIGVYAVTMARLFMVSQPEDIVSIANACPTGADVTSGIVMRNPEMQMATLSITLHSKQPKRTVLSFDKCFIEVMEYPRADKATITWTEDGRREEVSAGDMAYALCYEVADLEKAVAGDQTERAMIEYTTQVMEIMTKLRHDWGVVYPEER